MAVISINPPPARLPVSVRATNPDLYDWIQRANAILRQVQFLLGDDMALNYETVLFDSQVVTTGTDDLFTLTGVGQSIDDLKIRFTNITGSAATVSAWVQASGGSEASADKILSNYSINGNSYLDIDIPRMVGEGNQSKLTVSAGTGSAIVVSHLQGIRRS